MFYDLVVGFWNMPPSEFWQMTPREIQHLIESRRPKHIGGFHEDEFERLLLIREQMEKDGIEVA